MFHLLLAELELMLPQTNANVHQASGDIKADMMQHKNKENSEPKQLPFWILYHLDFVVIVKSARE